MTPEMQRNFDFLDEILAQSDDWDGLKLDDSVVVMIREMLHDYKAELLKSKELESKKQTQNVDQRFPAGFFDNPLVITSNDLLGLPDSLRTQINDLDETEAEVLELMEIAGGTLILDKIIAGLFYIKQKTYSRQLITAKLYRMSKKGLIRSVPRKKGVYTTNKDKDLS